MKLRYRRRLLHVSLALLAPALVAFGLAFVVLGLMKRDTMFVAQATAERARSIFDDAQRQLEGLANATGGECSDAAIQAMQRAVFGNLYLREAGVFAGHDLLCTNLGRLDPPLAVDEPDRLVVPAPGQIHIVPPVHTLQGGESIIVDYRVRDGVGVNVLINPELIAEVLEFFAAGDDGVVMLKLRDGRALTPLGARPANAVAVPEKLEPGFQRVQGGYVAVAVAGKYPVEAVITASDAWLLKRWTGIALWPTLAALVASLIAVRLASRSARREQRQRDSLLEALQSGNMTLHYQPLVDLDTGRCVGAEALLRWRHPTRGLVLPGEFIDFAENSGLIVPITAWVLARVKSDLPRLHAVDPSLSVGVNLSKQDLESDELVEALDRTFPGGAGLDRIVFEITERSLIAEGLERAQALVERLGEHGARFALDDFGTGYSGLSYLRHFTLSYLKIDGSFVRALDTEAVTSTIVDAIIALARSLALDVVAEGAETPAQAAALRAKGIRLAQGWLYAKAMPIEELERYVRDHQVVEKREPALA